MNLISRPIFALSLVVLFVGCTAEPAITPTTAPAVLEATGGDNLTQAFTALRQRAEGLTSDTKENNARPIFYLNQWIAGTADAKAAWTPDPMLENLPRWLQATPGLGRIAALDFNADDLNYLQQNLWLHDVTRRVRAEKPAADLAPWLTKIEKSVGLPESEQLALAERLFDWTIRNIQLDELPPPPKGPVATVGATADAGLPAQQGEPGPGYRHTPAEVLQLGHGDTWERSRVFLLLCRQVGIQGAMLGLVDETVSNLPRPWLPAVLIGGELYLFDAELGLPLPGPAGEGIATLSGVVADPQVLRQLDLEGAAYPVGAAQLKQIVALIDAEPAAASRRMAILEKGLAGSQRIDLAFEPSKLNPKLAALKEISGVGLWRVPLEAAAYAGWQNQQREARFGSERELMIFRLLAPADEVLLGEGNPLTWGRNLQLQGRLETKERQVGARALYMESRMPDQQIEALSTSETARQAFGWARGLPTDEKFRQQVLDRRLELSRRTKQHATYYLSLTYCDDGKYETAAQWLDERVLHAPLPSPWAAGARYNLARCYEALGRWDDAQKLLAADDSPQKHGNHLRAKLIAKRHGK